MYLENEKTQTEYENLKTAKGQASIPKYNTLHSNWECRIRCIHKWVHCILKGGKDPIQSLNELKGKKNPRQPTTQGLFKVL